MLNLTKLACMFIVIFVVSSCSISTSDEDQERKMISSEEYNNKLIANIRENGVNTFASKQQRIKGNTYRSTELSFCDNEKVWLHFESNDGCLTKSERSSWGQTMMTLLYFSKTEIYEKVEPFEYGAACLISGLGTNNELGYAGEFGYFNRKDLSVNDLPIGRRYFYHLIKKDSTSKLRKAIIEAGFKRQ